ncbi:MAG: gamma-glutamyltranspeptidase / glutathione hydrolase [Alphaproteobacteria bacterium]|nr:gamma-glutamyltranspeptidase / glutathione hydrolase [Alphaproteobacteria bacterium]
MSQEAGVILPVRKKLLRELAAALMGFGLWLALAAPGLAAVMADRHMVAAAHPLAAEAGRQILRDGGSAVDAAIAVQAVLGLVEPQSSGIGGGAFLMHWDQAHKQISAYDGRETAPAATTPDQFLKPDGQPLGFRDAFTGGRSVGVPGVIAMLALAHEKHGKLAWADLFAPAIALAENGFPVSARLQLMAGAMPKLPNFPQARALFFTSDNPPRPLPAGTLLRNADYAHSLRAIAADGPRAFYTGDLARAMVDAVKAQGGALSLEDLAGYRAIARPPVCGEYRDYKICGMPPPTSGGVAVLQILGMLENYQMAALAPDSVAALHLLAQAGRLAYADRGKYLADTDQIAVPLEALLAKPYLAGRARLMRLDAIGPSPVEAGSPVRHAALDFAPGMDMALPSTSHVSIIDGGGNAVSMTSSVEAPFGSHVMAGGFILNNQLTDFSFAPEMDGLPVANAAAPGKRPLSSMSPTLVFDRQGALYATLGSPGGTRIIGYVAQTLVGLLDWGLDMQAAIDQPRLINRNGPLELESGTVLEKLAPRFTALGHAVEIQPTFSGLQGIRVVGGRLEGGADRRREGAALGD